ncbi:M17 family metallopeptidase [Metamycoplasma hyosynoviae]|uniref:Probable cytosol aminopeptidase n=1 Tax=Metamycoplasma hyosynoviae TaxID=29559 RepID=A0A9Q9BVN8_9BACT|nr:M17 family metallopeptidase [Metamycoplasma hyosynoviae]MDD1358437.1 M17 family metallopeptidase [Metamycoplasma hyosynoviae]MDD1361187.1 M17 family metallopeptidase [Metamycoplasma hyosynoviae]UTO26048.1 M17 family metallopeptidase [Metamycoplasma hyosynoviae]UTO26720.1 M17 family metallopeptidase [Metamycoplasma hyosynoviae]
MITKYATKYDGKNILLKAFYEKKCLSCRIDEICQGCLDNQISTEPNYITEFLDKNEAYIFISKDCDDYYDLTKVVDAIILSKRRNYVIDVKSFANEHISIDEVLRAFVMREAFHSAELFSMKEKPKTEKEEKYEISLFLEDDSKQEFVEELSKIANAINGARNLQITPPNIATSEYIANEIKKEFSKNKNLKISVLNKEEIQKLGMNLLLAVNSGSSYEPRVVIIEYNGNSKSKEKFVYVGKGITFDTGGYNTKGYHMEGMKFDMSGSVICAYAVKALAELKVKANVAAVMMLTDNAIDTHATVPESVIKSLSGKSVEITDTDAEGRLVLADGLYYGATKLKASLLVDVATLTGTMLTALGRTYSGIYSTCCKRWHQFEDAAKIAHEKVWRMPLHEDFNKPNKESLIADLNNYSNNEKSDCNTAAMFLKEFTNKADYIHCDVAGTADKKGMGLGILVSTLVELGKSQAQGQGE